MSRKPPLWWPQVINLPHTTTILALGFLTGNLLFLPVIAGRHGGRALRRCGHAGGVHVQGRHAADPQLLLRPEPERRSGRLTPPMQSQRRAASQRHAQQDHRPFGEGGDGGGRGGSLHTISLCGRGGH